MKFDFVMCVHQDNPFLDRAISSMVQQDYDEHYGIIIIANNCTDELYEKLMRISYNEEKIRLERTLIGQLAFNLNYAANLSDADYLIRMDADDISLPERLHVTAKKIKELDYPDMLSGGVDYVDEHNIFIKKMAFNMDSQQLRKTLAYRNVVSHPASAIKRTSLLSARGYIGGLNSEDFDLWTRMLRKNMRLFLYPELVLKYRISSYQVKGSSIAYADCIGVIFREFILTGNPHYLFGTLIAIAKFIYLKLLGRFSS